MIIKEKTREFITITFSGNVGKEGLMRIKNFVELLENAGNSTRKKVSSSTINKLAEDVNDAAWKKFKKAKGLK